MEQTEAGQVTLTLTPEEAAAAYDCLRAAYEEEQPRGREGPTGGADDMAGRLHHLMLELLPTGIWWVDPITPTLTPEETDLAREHLADARNRAVPTDQWRAYILTSVLNKMRS